MKKFAFITAIALAAPAVASAQSCYDGYWSERDQTCVPMTEIIAQTVEDWGNDTPVQSYTDSTATYIRNYESNGGTASQR